MIVFTTERRKGACMVHLDGALDASDDPEKLVEHLVASAGTMPLLIDLSGLESVDAPMVGPLLRRLASAPTHETTALIHADLTARRHLRAVSNGLPVVPTDDLVLHGCFASALVAEQSEAPPRNHQPSRPRSRPLM